MIQLVAEIPEGREFKCLSFLAGLQQVKNAFAGAGFVHQPSRNLPMGCCVV